MMHRLTIAHEVVAPSPEAFVAPDGTSYVMRGDGNGLDQISDYAVRLAGITGQNVVYFEVFWPWETEESQTWDALRVDVSKIEAADPDDWWVETLPPYAELTAEQRTALGIGVNDGNPTV